MNDKRKIPWCNEIFCGIGSETGLLRLGFMTPKRVRATKIPWGVFSRGVNDSKSYSKVVFTVGLHTTTYFG